MNKRFCPTQEYDKMNRIPEKEPWHMESEDGKNLCGSTSRSTTPFESSVTCPKCLDILRNRKSINNFFYRENDIERRNVCTFCGAVHRNSTLKMVCERGKQLVVLSLCMYCRKFFIAKMKEFFK